MSLILIPTCAAVTAGVAFSANPLTGDRDDVRVSATRGLGDRLVGGEVDGDEWSVRAGLTTARALLPRSTDAIDAMTAQRIAALARQLEATRGVPEDIEWAIAGDRPITALPVAPVIATPKGSWQKDVGFFGPIALQWAI